MKNYAYIEVLNRLIETTIDSVEYYLRAADEALNDRYAGLFFQCAKERELVVDRLCDLAFCLSQRGGDDASNLVPYEEDILGSSFYTSAQDKALIDHLERAESDLKAKYEAVLGDYAIASKFRSVIERSYVSVSSSHDEIRNLKTRLDIQH